jgi:hypothetical protein
VISLFGYARSREAAKSLNHLTESKRLNEGPDPLYMCKGMHPSTSGPRSETCNADKTPLDQVTQVTRLVSAVSKDRCDEYDHSSA